MPGVRWIACRFCIVVEMRMMLAVKIEGGIELLFSWLQFVYLLGDGIYSYVCMFNVCMIQYE